jgi:hypothetical protein
VISVLSFACAKESFDKLRIKSRKKSTPAMIPIAIGTAIAVPKGPHFSCPQQLLYKSTLFVTVVIVGG